MENFDNKLTKEEIESRKKEDWLNFLRVRYDFPDEYDLIKKSDLKRLNSKKFFSGILTGIFILIGLIILASAIFYGSYYDKFKSDVLCQGSNLTCGDNTINPSPCECDLSCGNLSCVFPDKIEIKYTNSTG